MSSLTDQQLLREYAERRSESAFAELVRRHVDLVYSAALRMVCDSHLAEDVTQGAFLALARSAPQLTDRAVLSGWLHRTTQNLAAQTVRADVRRRAREQEAAAMNELLATEPEGKWEEIVPHLDAALGELSEADRDALLLRYFERKSAQEMAQVLGVSDEAAQKRVSRAVERLREFFAKRGVTVGASGLVVVLSTNAVQAAPAGLAATISSAAAVGGTTVGATTTAATAMAATIKTIAMTTLQKTIIATLIITAGVATPLVIHHQVRMREEKERARLALSQRPVPNPTTANVADDFPRETWTFRGYTNPESTVVSLAWAASQGEMDTFLNSLSPEQQLRERQRWQRQGEAQMRAMISKEFAQTKRIRILNRESLSETEMVLSLQVEGDNGRIERPRMKVQRIGDEWKMAGHDEQPVQEAP